MTTSVLFFEHRSGFTNNVSIQMAQQTIQHLVETLRVLRQKTSNFSLNCDQNLAVCEVAPQQSLNTLIDDPDVWRFLKSLQTRSPLSEGLEDWLDEITSNEVITVHGKPSKAMLCAHLLETATVSFFGESFWRTSQIQGQCKKLSSDGNIEQHNISIVNFSIRSHIQDHALWLESLGLSTNPTADQVWQERGQRFRGLRFLVGVEKQLADLSSSGAPYSQALATLQTLNEDSISWGGQGEPNFSIKNASGEHDQRRDLVEFEDEISGETLNFGRHVYFTGVIPGRIHFRVMPSESKFVVAHIGRKLGI